MVDTRFHRSSAPITLKALLTAVNQQSLFANEWGEGPLLSGAHELALAGSSHFALAAQSSYAEALGATRAGAVIVTPSLRERVPAHTLAIVAEQPHDLFVDMLDLFYPQNTRSVLSDATDEIVPILEGDVRLGKNVVLGQNVEIGDGTVIGANTVIGNGVTIGRNCTIAANCTIDCAFIGDNVVIQSGVRIGTEGFGWLDFGRTNRKIPQLGRVVVQDRVEIGANSTIDRGALGDTIIGEYTKIDNLVQIGHNCQIGRSCLIAAMTGLSGSTILGDSVLLGGGVGSSGHLSIGSGSVVHGRAAVTKDWPAGSKLAGAPAQDIRDFWRETATLRKLTKGDKRS